MTQTNVRSVDGASYLGVESTFGTLPTMSRCSPIADSVEIELMQDELEVDDESVYLYDKKTTVQGLKSARVRMGYYAKALSARLTSSTLTTPILYKALATLLGGQSPAESASVGNTISGGTATAPTLTSASNFTAGQFVSAIVSGVTECGRILTISTNTLNMMPGFSAAPTTSSAVGNMITLYPDESATGTLAFQHAKTAYSSEQMQVLGLTGGFQLQIANGQLVRFNFDLVGADWSDGALSLSTAAGSDSMGSVFAATSQKVLLQAYNTAAPTQFVIDDWSVEINHGMTHVPAHGGVQGKVGAMRTGQRLAAVIKVKVRADVDWMTNWGAQSLYQFFYAVPSGSGTSRQWFAFHAPRCQLVGKPTRIKGSENRVLYELTLHPQIDNSLGTAMLRAPWALGVG